MENFRAGRDAAEVSSINAGTLFEEQYRESCRPKEPGESKPGSEYGSATVERDPNSLPPTLDFPPIPGVCNDIPIATLPYLDYSWICRQPGMTWVLPQDAVKRPKYLDPGTPGRPR